MSAFRHEYLDNEWLNIKFAKMFKGRVYKMSGFGDQWFYETPKAKNRDNWFYFPKETTKSTVEQLVRKSVMTKKDYVYKATKDTPEPDEVTEYYALLDDGAVF